MLGLQGHRPLPRARDSVPLVVERRDRLGRRIGRNWWREYVTNAYRDARDHWLVQFDLQCNCTYRPGIIAQQRRLERRGGRREVTDWLETNPAPTFRQFLEGLAHDMRDQQAA